MRPSTKPATAIVSLIQTTIATVLGPLVGQLDAQRQTIERQADQLVGQAETIGQWSVTRRAGSGEARSQPRSARSDAPSARAHQRDATAPLLARVRALAPWVLAVLAIVAVVVRLGWPR